MKIENYWTQQQVYFYATCALFPENISNKILTYKDMDDYIPHYFDSNEQLDVLKELESENMLNVETQLDAEGENKYTITNINQEMFHTLLVEYLKKYRNSELVADKWTNPESFIDSEKKLLDYLMYTDRLQPIVNISNLWSNWNGLKTEQSPFWETVLSSSLLSETTRILKVGLYNAEPHSKNGTQLPYVEFSLTDKFQKETELSNKHHQPVVDNPSTPVKNIYKPLTPQSYDADSGTLFFLGETISIVKQVNRRGNKLAEPIQGIIMRKLFKDVNSLKNGVPLHQVASVRKDQYDAPKRKLTKNSIAEINRKVLEKTDVQKLINSDQVNYYIDRSYLL